MTKLLEEIYLMLTETNKFQCSKISEEESKAYKEIYEPLTEKQKSLFDRFVDILSARYCDDGERLFYEGFKLGFKLFTEVLYE